MKNNFLWAVEQMKKDKKVRRPHWDKGKYWQEKSEFIDSGIPLREPILDFTDYLATDWEIYEEQNIKETKDEVEKAKELLKAMKKKYPEWRIIYDIKIKEQKPFVLADRKCKEEENADWHYHTDDVKTFIQKIKEDVAREHLANKELFEKLIDKRAGDL